MQTNKPIMQVNHFYMTL